jgi:hypothetical protein
VTPRTFPPAPGWSPAGHRITVPWNCDRGPDKAGVYGALCVRDGPVLTQTAPSRNTAGDLALLHTRDQTDPDGDRSLVADPLAVTAVGPSASGWRSTRGCSTPSSRWAPPGST